MKLKHGRRHEEGNKTGKVSSSSHLGIIFATEPLLTKCSSNQIWVRNKHCTKNKINTAQKTDLVTFTEEVFNGKLHFLCSENGIKRPCQVQPTSWNFLVLKKVLWFEAYHKLSHRVPSQKQLKDIHWENPTLNKTQVHMIMDIWEIGINYLRETCNQIKLKKKMVSSKTPFFVIWAHFGSILYSPFCFSWHWILTWQLCMEVLRFQS